MAAAPIRGYKHLPKQFGASMCTGLSIQIATHESFAHIEARRADPQDGGATVRVTGHQVIPEVTPDIHRRLLLMGIDAQFAVDGHITDCEVYTPPPPAYVYCVSAAPDISEVGPDDVIIEITDMERFARCLRMASGGWLGPGVVDKVLYSSRDTELLVGEPAESNPFIKAKRFQFENEIRIVWRTRSTPKPYLRLADRELASLVRQVWPPVTS